MEISFLKEEKNHDGSRKDFPNNSTNFKQLLIVDVSNHKRLKSYSYSPYNTFITRLI